MFLALLIRIELLSMSFYKPEKDALPRELYRSGVTRNRIYLSVCDLEFHRSGLNMLILKTVEKYRVTFSKFRLYTVPINVRYSILDAEVLRHSEAREYFAIKSNFL